MFSANTEGVVLSCLINVCYYITESCKEVLSLVAGDSSLIFLVQILPIETTSMISGDGFNIA